MLIARWYLHVARPVSTNTIHTTTTITCHNSSSNRRQQRAKPQFSHPAAIISITTLPRPGRIYIIVTTVIIACMAVAVSESRTSRIHPIMFYVPVAALSGCWLFSSWHLLCAIYHIMPERCGSTGEYECMTERERAGERERERDKKHNYMTWLKTWGVNNRLCECSRVCVCVCL